LNFNGSPYFGLWYADPRIGYQNSYLLFIKLGHYGWIKTLLYKTLFTTALEGQDYEDK